MYTLIVVDDEKWVRHGLSTTIDWEAGGIKLLGEAEDGEAACRMIDMNAPDIIITDIRMPGMDGLALLEYIRERRLHCKVIMISGYSDFSYAQKALRFGAHDYVLKPIEETNLLQIVGRCIDDLEKERRKESEFKKMSGYIRESLPLARQRYLEMSLTGQSVTAQSQLHMKWKALNIGLDSERVGVFAVRLHSWGPRRSEEDRSLIVYSIGNMAEEIGLGWVSCPLDPNQDADLAVLYSSPLLAGDMEMDRRNYKFKLEKLIHAVHHYLGIQISIGISRERNWAALTQSFNESLHACAFAFFDGCGTTYDAVELPKMSDKPLLYPGPKNSWDTRLFHAMKLGDETMLKQLLDELDSHIISSRELYSPLHLYRGLAALLDRVVCHWEISCPLPETDHAFINRKKITFSASNFSHLNDYLLSIFIELIKDYRAAGSKKRIIELALDYIQDHFTEALKMNEVAEHLFINPSYFSKIFHEEMGETFSKYVSGLRVSVARRLLKQSTLKVYEVAHQVGYSDFRHFVKVFKDTEGITPEKYRNLGT